MSDLTVRLRKAARAVYLATEASVADDLSDMLVKAADLLESTDLDDATTAPDEAAVARTAGEFAARWNATDPDTRDKRVQHINEGADAAARCYVENHADRIRQLETDLAEARQRRDPRDPDSLDALARVWQGQHVHGPLGEALRTTPTQGNAS